MAGCSPDNAWSKAARRIRGDSYRFNEGGDREKPGAEEGDDVILVYYGPAKRSCRNLPAPLAFDWSDFHLHRFVIRGKEYGVSRMGCTTFTTDELRRLPGLQPSFEVVRPALFLVEFSN